MGEFLGADSEAVHRDEALLESLEGKTPEQQADLIYPLLRRATVRLERSGMREENVSIDVPAGYRRVACPQAVLNAARLQFSFHN